MDGLCLRAGIHGMSSTAIGAGGGSLDVRANPSQVSAVGRAGAAGNAIAVENPQEKAKTASSRFFFGYPLRSLWPGRRNRYRGIALDDAVLVNDGETADGVGDFQGQSKATASESQNGSWVLKILHVKSLWSEQEGDGADRLSKEMGDLVNEEQKGSVNGDDGGEEEEEDCDVCRVDDENEEKLDLDKDSFLKLLRRVTLSEAKLYAQMSYLGNLAYSIPRIQPGNLLQKYRLHFVTSSVEKKERADEAEKDLIPSEAKEAEGNRKEAVDEKAQTKIGYRISASAAYQIAASAASYLQFHTRSILPFKSSKDKVGEDSTNGDVEGNDGVNVMDSEVASFMATTDSVTAVVAAKEEVKQAVANDLNSTRSSPCDWYICDDDLSRTRFFVIQGSESLASWQANLLFEPIQFEGLDVLVHRGIYEAAKGIYVQMLPEVHAHLRSHGDRATFRFTGHSLGGSLALLVNLMLLIRGEVPLSSLLPVITFGSPSIMCGGDRLLHELGLPRSHVQAVTMHRDIVPRAFSCNYPNHVAELLKAVNGNFRNHPCLNNLKLLYAPMGDLLILQPDEKLSPHHHLLPSGSGLYLLTCPALDASDAARHLQAAQSLFLNSPHPLEILSDRSAYGSEGSIQRDHDMSFYVRSVRSVIRQELNQIRRTKREHRFKVWWPRIIPRGIHAGVIIGMPRSINVEQDQFSFSGMLQTGRESLKRFTRLVASQHMHLLVVLLFPAKLLLLGTFSVISFR